MSLTSLSFLSRRRFALLAGTAGAVVLGAGGLIAAGSTSSSPPAEDIIVCESNTVDQDGIETSSSVASRVPAGTPVPEGCKRRN